MKILFTGLYDFFHKHRSLFWLCLLLSCALAVLGASRLRFVDDINRMIPHDPAVEAMNNVLNKTKTGEQIIFTLSYSDSERTDPDSLILHQHVFQTELENSAGNAIKNIRAYTDEEQEQLFTDIALQYLPLFLNEKDYVKIDSLIRPEAIRTTLEQEHKLLLSPAGVVAKNWIAKDPVGIVPLALEKLKALGFDPNYQLYDGYIFDQQTKRLYFFLELNNPASATGANQPFFKQLDHLISGYSQQHPEIHLSYFGGPAVAAANALQMRQDTILTLSITVVLLLAFTWYIFRRRSAPFILIVPVLFGALFGMAITALVQGVVSVIALGAGAIILGIAIDFSVHFMSHARIHPDMRENVSSLTNPLTLGAFTTIGAFYALRFCHAPLLQDLGLFAAASLAGASLFTLIFLPHLLHSKKSSAAAATLPDTFIDKLARLKPEGNKWLLGFVILATPVLGYFAQQVTFDGDLMHLNYLSPELKAAQDELNRNNAYALSSVFVVAKGNTTEAALEKLEAASTQIQSLQKSGHVRNSLNPVVILPSEKEQQRRLQQWQQYWTPERTKRSIEAVQQSAVASGFSNHAFDDFSLTLQQSYQPFDNDARTFLQNMLPASFSQQKGENFAVAALKVEPGARKTVLQSFKNDPNVIATDRQSVSEKLLDILKNEFNTVLWYSGLLVFFALLLAYGRIELALISFLPMAVTWVWILGIMSLFGLEFNIVNIIISTLIFGLGDDYSIFMMDSLMEKYRKGSTQIAHTRSAVYLSVVTTVIGLGTLIFAKHPALHSIAIISTTGLLCVVFVSQVLQPFLFNFMIQRRADRGFMPFTLWSLLKSVWSFLYFFLACIVVTITGMILIGLRPFGAARSKYLFHYILSKGTLSVMYMMVNLKKRVIHIGEENFKTPAVYIANHASFLDILLTTMLHPRLILLTNRWVWHSPVFGKIVRMAEYYPVANGAADSIAALQKITDQGYGIIVFPEGTRSYDDTIHRFHKGAFYIAEQLHLDVVPVVLHGVHYTMQKGDWLLKDGTTTVKIFPRIKIEDTAFGTHYSERARYIRKWFKEKFQEEKAHNETPRYFYEQMTKGNLYKGPVLDWYGRIKIKGENYYEVFHELLPREGTFYDLGCGYGFMTYMLHWASESRNFTGVDYDEEKIIVAQNHYARNARKLFTKQAPRGSQYELDNPAIRFQQADVTEYHLQPCNGIIISDMLHYLLPQQQIALLEKCYEALLPDGMLIIRDGVEELTKRHRGTKLSEFFSTRIIRFNKTQNKLHYISSAFIKNWAIEKNLSLEIIDNTKKTSNLIFVLKKNHA